MFVVIKLYKLSFCCAIIDFYSINFLVLFLELEAYSTLVSALRAQGSLNQEKRRLLKETCTALNISTDRHKAEIRRAISDERLNTIAYQ